MWPLGGAGVHNEVHVSTSFSVSFICAVQNKGASFYHIVTCKWPYLMQHRDV